MGEGMVNYVWYVIEVAFTSGMLIKAILFVPQAIKIYRAKKARELSLATFAGLSGMQILTMLHAGIHGDYILFFGVLLSFVPCALITSMIIIYRKN